MGLFDRFSLFPVRIGDQLLRQVHDLSIRDDVSKVEVQLGGDLDRSAVITSFAEPMFHLKTSNIDTITGFPLTTGYACTTYGAANAASIFQFQQRADGAGFGGGQDQILSVQKGFACIRSLECDQDSRDGALIDLEFWALSLDGQTTPLTLASGALISTPLFNSLYFLGPVWMGDPAGVPTLLKGVQSVKINPGIAYRVKRSDGDPFAAIGSILGRRPEIRIVTDDVRSLYAAISAAAGDLTGFNVTNALRLNCFFQKGSPGPARIAKNIGQHWRITAITGDMTPDSFSVRQNDDWSAEVIMRPTGVITATALQVIPPS